MLLLLLLLLFPPPNIDVKPLKKPPEEEEEEEEAASDEPGRENQLLLLLLLLAAVVAAAACVGAGAGAIGSNADPLSLKAGSFGPESLRILMVSETGVGWTLKLTDVSSRLTNSTPSDFPTPGVMGGVPEIFRWLPRRPRSKSSMLVISVAPKSLSPPM